MSNLYFYPTFHLPVTYEGIYVDTGILVHHLYYRTEDKLRKHDIVVVSFDNPSVQYTDERKCVNRY